MNTSVLTVTQLNKYIKSLIDGDINISNCFVEGEISNFKNHFLSGHLYFSIKDKDSVIKCVMFNRAASRIKFEPTDGMQVILRGSVSVYERDGQYQIYVEDMQPLGIGALAVKYEQLKEKLKKEGLFSPDTKRPLPKVIKRIAVITAETGAAVQDIFSVSQRRNPAIEIVFCPVIVQGDNAPDSMINALEKVYSCDGIDVIIIGRGGGSFEDLFCFNDENLIRKIYESPVPVISAVGHESDFTLCDFVADIRAATPSSAAELAVESTSEIKGRIEYFKEKLNVGINLRYETDSERFDRCISSNFFKNPTEFVLSKQSKFLSEFSQFKSVSKSVFLEKNNEFTTLLQSLNALNPISILSRGYSLATINNSIIKSTDQISVGSKINVKFANGSADCEVLKINEGEKI